MITEKRTSLEEFIKEQLIGPGGCNHRYSVFHEDTEELESVHVFGEVLNTTPGSIYSSAILFPQQTKEDTQTQIVDTENSDVDSASDVEPNDDDNKDEELDEEINFDHAEDIDSLGRRFPSKFGISCCLDESLANDELKITVSGRYYQKVKLASSLRIKIDDPEGFQEFISSEEFVKQVGKLVKVDNFEIRIINGIPAAQLKQVRDGLREVNKCHCQKIATNSDGSLCSIYSEPSFKPEYRFLSAYKERLLQN